MSDVKNFMEWAHTLIELTRPNLPLIVFVILPLFSLVVALIKVALFGVDEEKPKHQSESAYILDDDGELLEVINEKPKRHS